MEHPPIFERSDSSCFDPVPLFYSKSLSLSLLDDDDDSEKAEPIGLSFLPEEMDSSRNFSDGKTVTNPMTNLSKKRKP